MSHSSKWTFKDKGFLFCKLQLTAFNSQIALGFPSSWSDSDVFLLLALYTADQTQEMEIFIANVEIRWARVNFKTKPKAWIAPHSHRASSFQEVFPVCQVAALSWRHNTLWELSALHRCRTCSGSQAVAPALTGTHFVNTKIHFTVEFETALEKS